MVAEAAIEFEKVQKTYELGKNRVSALRDVSLTVSKGEFLVIMGPSGSGKSTLLSLMGGLDQPTAGRCVVAGKRLDSLDDQELAHFRNRTVGFVFQAFNLIGDLTSWENVALPLYYAKVPLKKRKALATDALRRVGLGHRLAHSPNELSGGEQQRVAVARALVNEPEIVLADEPTGNLDTATGQEIVELLQAINARGTTLVVVTHNPAIAEKAQRVVQIVDGRLAA